MNSLKILFAGSFLLFVNVFVIGQEKVAKQSISSYLNIDLLSAELVGLYSSLSNESRLAEIDNNFIEATTLKNFAPTVSSNKLKFETLLKEHKYYNRQANKNLKTINLLNKETKRIELHDSFWKSNMKMQYKNNYSSIGNWHFKLGPTY